jgi:hypothetical protein
MSIDSDFTFTFLLQIAENVKHESMFLKDGFIKPLLKFDLNGG